jgi:hypothetical protein
MPGGAQDDERERRVVCDTIVELLQRRSTVRRSEVQAIGQLAGEALAAGGALVEQVHLGIAQRAFAHAPASTPVRVVHDGISKAVYAGVRGGLRGVAHAGGRLAASRAREDGPSLSAHPRAALALGALNGLYGNHVAQRAPALAFDMEIRRHGRAVALKADTVRAAFPDATSRIAVFVHGLGETDHAWRLVAGGPGRADHRTYGERLQDELSYTPVYVRYNSGLQVSENGRLLAGTLEALVEAWPVGVAELVMIGHSTGGLVSRSACDYGELRGMRFIDAVRHVFCLGTPHLGADLEKGASVLSFALRRLPETRALARFLDARSVGIRDLRPGVQEKCGDGEPDEFLRDRCHELGGVNHLALLNHPAVYEQLRLWITRCPRRPLAALPAPRGPVAMLGR